MEAIVFNNRKSKLNQLVESSCLRSAYFLCDKLTSAGNSIGDIWFEEVAKKASLEAKLCFIEDASRNTDNPITNTREALQTLKDLAKIKHKNTQQIILEK